MTKKQINDIKAGIWLIGLAILFFTGKWWPGILILVGVSMVVENILRERVTEERSEPIFPPTDFSANEPLPQPSPLVEPAAPITPAPAFVPAPPIPAQPPADPVRPVDLLPATCDACGAPVRGMDVTWTGFASANCAFCGAPLKMK